MPWREIWQTISSWPAAIAAGIRAAWPQLRLALAGIAGAYVERQREARKEAEQRVEDAAKFDDDQRRLRVDPSYREQLRRESGKPPRDK